MVVALEVESAVKVLQLGWIKVDAIAVKHLRLCEILAESLLDFWENAREVCFELNVDECHDETAFGCFGAGLLGLIVIIIVIFIVVIIIIGFASFWFF